jgi:hypothetical protein
MGVHKMKARYLFILLTISGILTCLGYRSFCVRYAKAEDGNTLCFVDSNEPVYEFTVTEPEYNDLFIDIDGDRVNINYDPNTKVLSSDRTAEDTFRLLYRGISMMPGTTLRTPHDWNEPIKVEFAEVKNEGDSNE